MRKFVKRLLREDEGQDLVEYVLLVSLIALAVAPAFPPVTEAITAVFNTSVPRSAAAAVERRRRSRDGDVRRRHLASDRVTRRSGHRRVRPPHGVFRHHFLAVWTRIRDAVARATAAHTGVHGLWDPPHPGGS